MENYRKTSGGDLSTVGEKNLYKFGVAFCGSAPRPDALPAEESRQLPTHSDILYRISVITLPLPIDSFNLGND